jgi:quinol monooxygenase YgiN
MTELQVIARYRMAAGHEADVLALLPSLAAAALTEPGCLAFTAYRQLDDDRNVVLLERYESRQAFADHRDSPHFHEIVQGQLLALLEHREVESYDVG